MRLIWLIFRSYVEDFRAQYYQYENHREIFMATPTSTEAGIISLRDLIDFISHVADCYPDITKDFPQQLIDMLMQHHVDLEPELREKIVGSLVLLRKKEIIDSVTYVWATRHLMDCFLTDGMLQTPSHLVSDPCLNTEQDPTPVAIPEDPFWSANFELQVIESQA